MNPTSNPAGRADAESTRQPGPGHLNAFARRSNTIGQLAGIRSLGNMQALHQLWDRYPAFSASTTSDTARDDFRRLG